MDKLTPEQIMQQVDRVMLEARYGAYLQSPEWQARKRAKLSAADYTCEECGYPFVPHRTARQFEVHHKTYERLGNERREDLVVLCSDCHEKAHGK